MGKPEDISERPVTEKDVRRICRDEIKKCAEVDSAVIPGATNADLARDLHTLRQALGNNQGAQEALTRIREACRKSVLSRCGFCDEPVHEGEEARYADGRQVYGSGPTFVHRTCFLFADRRTDQKRALSSIDFAMVDTAIKTVRDFLEGASPECERALDTISGIFVILHRDP